jgi:hypothetical protein
MSSPFYMNADGYLSYFYPNESTLQLASYRLLGDKAWCRDADDNMAVRGRLVDRMLQIKAANNTLYINTLDLLKVYSHFAEPKQHLNWREMAQCGEEVQLFIGQSSSFIMYTYVELKNIKVCYL